METAAQAIGKRFRPAVAAFHFDQERALWKLHEELATKTYRPGAYRSFFIYEPKKRQISAAPFAGRVGGTQQRLEADDLFPQIAVAFHALPPLLSQPPTSLPISSIAFAAKP